jgi:hypothetical protein
MKNVENSILAKENEGKCEKIVKTKKTHFAWCKRPLVKF